mmetsp:Transcript_18777/g.24871  ORF Transcript_18777/g.24871 Transcript_18777/m.24871 type:complete len:261 (-) Transcript_18777:270-1052(-)
MRAGTMPRGKNYVNNNRGVNFQAPTKKKGSQMVACQYGDGCTRKGCIYRHPNRQMGTSASKTPLKKSTEPCMPFLAGMCSFSESGCRKRHPGKVEAERLVVKYSSTPCRYGSTCRTRGCLYIHPYDEGNEPQEEDNEMFPTATPNIASTYAIQTPYQANMEELYYAQQVVYDHSSENNYSQPESWEQSNDVYATEEGGYFEMQSDVQPQPDIVSPSYNNIMSPYEARELTFDSMKDEVLMCHDINGTNIHAKEFVPGNWS